MNEKPHSPPFDPDTIAEIQKGVEEFNSGRFFECHDTLEEVWRGTRGDARDFFQGLIQVSVGFYHLDNGNRIGAQSQLEKALKNLARYGDSYAGMELAELRRRVQSWLDRIRNAETITGDLADLPKFRFTPNR